MIIYRGQGRAEGAARARANAEGQAFVIFKGPGPDHIIQPKPDLTVGAPLHWPGGRECWAEVGQINPTRWRS